MLAESTAAPVLVVSEPGVRPCSLARVPCRRLTCVGDVRGRKAVYVHAAVTRPALACGIGVLYSYATPTRKT